MSFRGDVKRNIESAVRPFVGTQLGDGERLAGEQTPQRRLRGQGQPQRGLGGLHDDLATGGPHLGDEVPAPAQRRPEIQAAHRPGLRHRADGLGAPCGRRGAPHPRGDVVRAHVEQRCPQGVDRLGQLEPQGCGIGDVDAERQWLAQGLDGRQLGKDLRQQVAPGPGVDADGQVGAGLAERLRGMQVTGRQVERVAGPQDDVEQGLALRLVARRRRGGRSTAGRGWGAAAPARG